MVKISVRLDFWAGYWGGPLTIQRYFVSQALENPKPVSARKNNHPHFKAGTPQTIFYLGRGAAQKVAQDLNVMIFFGFNLVNLR